jgi:ubiquinone/menaquinone biosynthesis C-methylase UbiE
MKKNNTCELVNTYEVLEHIMGIDGLHPHSLKTIDYILNIVAEHVKNQKGVVLDIGCGSGKGTYNLSKKVSESVSIIGIDINKSSIEKASMNYSKSKNLSFYHGDLDDFRKENNTLKIIGIVAISVSMFLPDIEQFYKVSRNALSDNGIFIDAPFVFNHAHSSESFKLKTYAVCGCNMTMHTKKHLEDVLISLGFRNVKSELKKFELMDLKILFKDYPLRLLLFNFFKNSMTPPTILKTQTSRYLFKRTISIFNFFMKNKNEYGAGIIMGIKKGAR